MALRLQADREQAALRRHAQHALSVRSPGVRPAGTGPLHRRRGSAGVGGAVLVAALLVSVAGCNTFDDPPPCPRVSILKQTSLLTLYGEGPGRDDADVAFELALRDVASDCDLNVDDEAGGGVAVTFALPIYATRGPAAETDRLSVPFFVALADPGRQIVAKEIFTAEIAFDADARARRRWRRSSSGFPSGRERSGRDTRLSSAFSSAPPSSRTPGAARRSRRPATQSPSRGTQSAEQRV